MARIYGVATFPGSGVGIICNSYNEDESIEKAQARNETGRVIDEWAYSKTCSFSATGLIDDVSKLPQAGDTFVLNGKTYLLDSISKPRTNTGAAEVSFSGSLADSAELHTYTSTGSLEKPEQPENSEDI